MLRSTAIGAYVGMLPGLGGSIVDCVAYGHVVRSTKDKEGVGKGDVRGVIAPETANNAMKGGRSSPPSPSTSRAAPRWRFCSAR